MVTLGDIADDLADEVDDLAQVAASNIYAALADYVAIGRPDLLESIGTNIRRAVDCLHTRRIPDDIEGIEPQRTTRRRMEQGMPIDAIMRAYRLNLTSIHHRFIELARQRALSAEETLFGSTLLWEVGDWFLALAVHEYRTRAVPDEVRRSVEKADVLRALGDPDTDTATTLQRAQRLGLRDDLPYRVVMTPTAEHEDWVSRIEQHGATVKSPAFAASLGGFAIGVVARDPREALTWGSIAAGPWEPLQRIDRSWHVARRVLEVVTEPTGEWQDAETATWRLAVSGDDLVVTTIADKYLPRLSDENRLGTILLESAWAYLECSQNVGEAARRLVVHENTLRYRLRRFEELTGAALSDVDVVIELAWLREASRRG